MEQQPAPQPKTPLEEEVRKPKKGRKKDRVKFNLTFEEKDVKIFFN